MATNKRDLKAYSRFDGTGRIVPGSTVLRRNKPKNGNWKEIQTYECCDVKLSKKIISYTCEIPEEQQIYIETVVRNPDCYNFYNSINLTSNITTYNELINFLNVNYSFLGLFSYTAPNTISLQISSTGIIGEALNNCPDSSWELIVAISTSA